MLGSGGSWIGAGGGGGGSGDVVGPASSTDNALVRFDLATGKLVQNSVAILGDTGNLSGVANLTVTGTTTLATALTGVLHGASGVVSASAVVLTSEVSGILPVANGGSGTSTAFTQGSVIFAGASGVFAQDNAGFFYDATNHRHGINNTAPSTPLDLKSAVLNFTMTAAPTTAPTSALAGLGAGNLSAGAYTYTVTYTSQAGESQASSASNSTTVVTPGTNGQISLTSIPVSPDPLVTGRRIFRTQAGGSTRTLVGTIANNTGTTFTDNVADATIVSASQAPPVSYNSSWGIWNDGAPYLFGRGNANTFLGPGAGSTTCDPVLTNNNVGVGRLALGSITGGSGNMAIGTQALGLLTTGGSNTCVGGAASGGSIVSTSFNTIVGATAAPSFVGSKIVAIGRASAVNSTSGDQSVYIGDLAGTGATSATQCIYLGCEATGSSALTKAVSIGYQASVSASNNLVLGGTGSNSVQVAINATSATAQLDVICNSSSRIVQIVKGAASQSASLAEFQNSSSTALMTISAAGKISLDATNTAGGSTGNKTIDKPSGTVNFAAAGTTLTVTNSTVTANSIVLCQIMTNDTTAVIKNVVPSSGSFVITLNAAATAETRVGFVVIN